MSVYRTRPTPFLEVRVQESTEFPTLLGLCAGFEAGSWRSEAFADYLFHYLPEFALTHGELEQFGPSTAHQLLRNAAKSVYMTEKFGKRGEFGELLLHAIVRQEFDSEPAVSKLYYKDSANNTVKGFDGVHVVAPGSDELELWLGEAKFYDDAKRAIRDVVAELQSHFDADFLRAEFAVVTRQLDDSWEHSEQLVELLDEHTSLDQIVNRIRVPVLLTYDSEAVDSHSSVCDEYIEEFIAETRQLYATFREKSLPAELLVHLMLVPLLSKADFVAALHDKLKTWQRI